jgi:dipeptidyl aminopeptidase/acylaminoacyl peptidase
VQAIACFFPPTDFLNWGKSGVNGVGVGPVAGYRDAFGPKAGSEELGKQISPIYSVTEKTPPTLLIHGDSDRTVPLQQSEIFIARLKEAGVKNQFVVLPGKDHGWPTIFDDLTMVADWFDQNLRGIAAPGQP